MSMSTRDRYRRHRVIWAPDLEIVCWWAAFGLTLAALACASGFGNEIAEALLL